MWIYQYNLAFPPKPNVWVLQRGKSTTMVTINLFYNCGRSVLLFQGRTCQFSKHQILVCTRNHFTARQSACAVSRLVYFNLNCQYRSITSSSVLLVATRWTDDRSQVSCFAGSRLRSFHRTNRQHRFVACTFLPSIRYISFVSRGASWRNSWNKSLWTKLKDEYSLNMIWVHKCIATQCAYFQLIFCTK